MISELDEFDSYTAFSSRVRGFEAQTRMKGAQIGDIDEYLRNMQISSKSKFRFKIKFFIFNVRISAYDPDPFDPDHFDFLSLNISKGQNTNENLQ